MGNFVEGMAELKEDEVLSDPGGTEIQITSHLDVKRCLVWGRELRRLVFFLL
jgi:hypothetical protein